MVYEHFRPHWSQAGAIVFITFRTHDSIPRAVLETWEKANQAWLAERIGIVRGHWKDVIEAQPERIRDEFHRTFNRTRELFLDDCYGRCLLRKPELAKIVANSLLHFDGERYQLGDFVVMPNHVHLLASFPTEEAMKAQCRSWLHYTAYRINQAIGERGSF